VLDFATKEQHRQFLENCPIVEKNIVDAGIFLIKIWLEVRQEEQEKRFLKRIHDPMRQWKLSPMDVESYRRWYHFSKARDLMLAATDSKHAPWVIVRSDDKRRGRLNCVAHILAAKTVQKSSAAKGQAAIARQQAPIRRFGIS
jgi:polyphosphate kinase